MVNVVDIETLHVSWILRREECKKCGSEGVQIIIKAIDKDKKDSIIELYVATFCTEQEAIRFINCCKKARIGNLTESKKRGDNT